jgi:hypothetical protein
MAIDTPTFDAVDTDATTDTNGQSQWEQSAPCKRHSYKGGNTCIKCGTPKPVRIPSRKVSDGEPSERGVSAPTKTLRQVLSLTWMGLGVGIEKLPDKWERLEPIRPVGKVIQYESAVAGTRIQKALRKTALWTPIMAFLRQMGPWTELAPLLAPPIIVGMMSIWPKLQENTMLTGMLVAMMIPLAEETKKMAEEQKELMSQMGQFTQENMIEAMGVISEFFGTENVET